MTCSGQEHSQADAAACSLTPQERDELIDAHGMELAESRIHVLVTAIRDELRKVREVGRGEHDELLSGGVTATRHLNRVGAIMISVELLIEPALNDLVAELAKLGLVQEHVANLEVQP